MTKRAERVYLSFYESNGADNAERLARAIRQVLVEVTSDCHGSSPLYLREEIQDICEELEDPNLLDGIYGNCYD